MTEAKKQDYNDCNLFDNPMVKQARENMSKEEIDRYQRIGEDIYANVDFENNVVLEEGNVINTLTPEMQEGIRYIKHQLESGLHPSALEEHEKIFMADALGKEWYLKYGYVEGDLEDIITCK